MLGQIIYQNLKAWFFTTERKSPHHYKQYMQSEYKRQLNYRATGVYNNKLIILSHTILLLQYSSRRLIGPPSVGDKVGSLSGGSIEHREPKMPISSYSIQFSVMTLTIHVVILVHLSLCKVIDSIRASWIL